MGKKEAVEVLSIGGREVRITNPDKLYFSRQTKVSKLELVRYYLAVAPGALAGIQDRPVVPAANALRRQQAHPRPGVSLDCPASEFEPVAA